MDLRGRLACVRRLRPAALIAALILVALPGPATAGFQVGLQDPSFDGTVTAAKSAAGYGVMSAAGGSVVRLNVFWSDVSPTKPGASTTPSDPAYRWTALDAAVRDAAAHHVTPLLTLATAPKWAQGPHHPPKDGIGVGAWDPKAADLGRFAQAVAERYSGGFPDPLNPGQDLPRVKYFEVWNEPNLPLFLAAPHLVSEYRSMLSDAYRAIKAVDRTDQVVMGGLAPVSYQPGFTVSPLKFAAEMMCLRRAGKRFVRTGHCRAAPFDIFAEHPYSLAVTPTQPAGSYDDVLVADVHKLRDLLDAASRLHTIARGPHPLWFTEWGWVTKPPDSKVGDSFSTAGRYVAYSMYEMWRAGGSLVVWQGIHDGAPGQLGGTGLETSTGRVKPSLKAFGVPFIASVTRRGGFAWGRVPVSAPASVAVQQRTRHGWRTVAHAKTGSDGVFSVHFRGRGNATFRAQGGGVTSLPYYSAPIPARRTHLF
jgi:hypothetical protein